LNETLHALSAAESNRLAERLRLLEQVGGALYLGFASTLDFEQLRGDPWQALAFFLNWYAFEHQGRSPAYGPVASDVVLESTDKAWSKSLAEGAWQSFKEKVSSVTQRQDAKYNERNNPMCPQGTLFKSHGREIKTKQPSVIEFVCDNLADAHHNIVGWAEEQLIAGGDGIRVAHRSLQDLNGIGPKIASLFLRDVALLSGKVGERRELLQPVDIWVERCVQYLERGHLEGRDRESGDQERLKYAVWIVEKSRAIGVSPEKVNGGMWYFGAQIATNEYTLAKCLASADLMQEEADKHMKRLKSQVHAWSR
jgi:hypothetical protein